MDPPNPNPNDDFINYMNQFNNAAEADNDGVIAAAARRRRE